MCVFLSTLSKRSKTVGTNKKRNLVLGIRPCPDTKDEMTWYRFRLLNFAAKNSDRDYPFIERYIHQKWRISEKGYPEIEDEVVCPVTKWIEWEGNRYDTCPICRYANQQYVALKASNWKDADARKKNKDFGRKYQAIIPVYVVNDPNYEGNNGKFKVIIFNDKKFYQEFVKKIEHQLLKANCFNGTNAVDCCIHMSLEETPVNVGQPNEYVWKHRVIDKIAFSKPYDLPAITKEAIDDFPFDEEYYVGSTKDELDEFYKKYIKVSNDDIVIDESEDINIYDNNPADKVKKTNAVSQTALENTEAPKADIADVAEEIESCVEEDSDELNIEAKEEPAKVETSAPASNEDAGDVDIQAMLDKIDIIE